MKKLLFTLLLMPLIVSAQTHQVTVITDSLGFLKTRHFKVDIIDPLCSKCCRIACIWALKEWYCDKHYKMYFLKKKKRNHETPSQKFNKYAYAIQVAERKGR